MECTREFQCFIATFLTGHAVFLHVKFGFVDLENKALKLHSTVYPVNSFQLFVSRIY